MSVVGDTYVSDVSLTVHGFGFLVESFSVLFCTLSSLVLCFVPLPVFVSFSHPFLLNLSLSHLSLVSFLSD